jgi:hypothetical protein
MEPRNVRVADAPEQLRLPLEAQIPGVAGQLQREGPGLGGLGALNAVHRAVGALASEAQHTPWPHLRPHRQHRVARLSR